MKLGVLLWRRVCWEDLDGDGLHPVAQCLVHLHQRKQAVENVVTLTAERFRWIASAPGFARRC